jgi:hypothetical protein
VERLDAEDAAAAEDVEVGRGLRGGSGGGGGSLETAAIDCRTACGVLFVTAAAGETDRAAGVCRVPAGDVGLVDGRVGVAKCEAGLATTMPLRRETELCTELTDAVSSSSAAVAATVRPNARKLEGDAGRLPVPLRDCDCDCDCETDLNSFIGAVFTAALPLTQSLRRVAAVGVDLPVPSSRAGAVGGGLGSAVVAAAVDDFSEDKDPGVQ